MHKNLIYSIIGVLLSIVTDAQGLLSLEDALKSALEKNHGLLIYKNEKKISELQNNAGNAGMSPQVSLNGNLNMANVNSYQEFGNGTVQDRNGAQSVNAGASLNVNWIVFDGLKMFAVKKRLSLNEGLNDLELKQQMENTIYNVTLNYYEIVRLQKLIKASEYNLSVLEERKKLAKMKLDIGSDSKVDLLMTQTEENKARTDLVKLKQQLSVAKISLNQSMVKPVEEDFKVMDSIPLVYEPVLEDLKKNALRSNSSILIGTQNELISEQMIKEARSGYMPLIQVNGAYNFIRNQSQAGFVLLNRQLGINGGVTASWLLFNGTKNKKLIQERQLSALSTRFLLDEKKQQIDALVYTNYLAFLSSKQVVDMEKQNLNSSQELLNVSIERYRIGKADLLETKETQKIFEEAQSRYINALYDAKRAETELMKANGSLVK